MRTGFYSLRGRIDFDGELVGGKMGGDEFNKSGEYSLRDILRQKTRNANSNLERYLNEIDQLIMKAAVEAADSGCTDLYFLLLHESEFEIGTKTVDTQFLIEHFEKLNSEHFFDVEIESYEYMRCDEQTSCNDDEYDGYINTVHDSPHRSPNLERGNIVARILTSDDDDTEVKHYSLVYYTDDDSTPLFYLGEIPYCSVEWDENCGCEFFCECEDDEDCDCGPDCSCVVIDTGDWYFNDEGDSISTEEELMSGARKMPVRVFDSEGISSSLSSRKRKHIEWKNDNDHGYTGLLMCFELTENEE